MRIDPSSRFRLPVQALLLLASSALVSVVALSPAGQLAMSGFGGQVASACPGGYEYRDPVEVAEEYQHVTLEKAEQIHAQYGQKTCVWNKLPESFAEFGRLQQSKAEVIGDVPAGLFRQAVEQKAALMAEQKSVASAVGSWQEYGKGPQLYTPAYEAVSGNDGLHQVSGRVDNFAYDETNKRLFASVGNGGIWMSTATGGDITKLGERWTSVGDKLPTLVASGVAWTPAGGGTLIAVTGEHTQGGNAYIGLGAYWTNDLGNTWNHATGVPDGAFGFEAKVDGSNPNIVYASTGKGLYRSTDAGRSYTNVALPVSTLCAGNISNPKCGFANFVTGLVVKAPGGKTSEVCSAKGCPVLAAVGYRAGNLPYADGSAQSPGNGLYRSSTGEPGTFVKIEAAGPNPLLPAGFAPQDRIGRVQMGNAFGATQDHNIVYALVQDARLFNRTSGPLLDADTPAGGQLAIDCSKIPPTDIDDEDIQYVCGLANTAQYSTYFNGVYVTTDFGTSWTRMADDAELVGTAGATGSSLATTAALGVAPGVQSWYNQWISVDPTQTDTVTGAPTRIAFGLEEIWTNIAPVPLNGPEQAASPSDFKVIGTYFAGKTCQFLVGSVSPTQTPACPTSSTQVSTNRTTTHPDQHAGIFIPDGAGGVYLFAGNDGGIYKQRSTNAATDPLTNDDWGEGQNADRYTLMNYGVAVAKDGTVWYGLQDNASGKIDPKTREQQRVYVGDGVWTGVDPDNSKIAYFQTPSLSLHRTIDGGVSQTSINSSSNGYDVGTAQFLSPFQLDSTNAKHMVAAGTKVAESLNIDTTATWTTVYDLGVNPVNNTPFQVRHRPLDVVGDYVYVGACAPCNLVGSSVQFQRKIATNVGGSKPAKKGTVDGWHDAKMAGLPNRFIYNIFIDREDPSGKTIYVALGGYSTARWAGVGQQGDTNTNVQQGKNLWVSKDAGESFTAIQGNLPDTITTAVLKRGNQLIVGTDIGVFISADLTGAEWVPLGNHPSVPVNQLVLKPGDDTQLFSASFGRGVLLYDFKSATTATTTPTSPTPAIGVIAPVASGSGSSSVNSQGRFGGGALGLLPLLLLAAAGVGRRRRR